VGEFVRLDVERGVGTIRLDRPPANAISRQVSDELRQAVLDAAGRDDVGAIVVWGGPTIFAAGADIKEMAGWGPEQARSAVSALGDAVVVLEEIPKVTIAAVEGFCLGGGCELALACDFRVAGEGAELGQPEIKLGIIPGAGGTQRLPRLVGHARARELVYSGRRVGAEEALRIGLVDRVVPAGDANRAAVKAAIAYARGPRQALAAAKEALNAAALGDPRRGLALERDVFAGLFGTPDQREGMAAFRDKREPNFAAGGETQ
jgi:enoyl-CoA hydratase/carnithine racemase